MSSILDALKKAEQESIPDNGVDTPWPPLPAKPGRKRFRAWWMLVGILVLISMSGMVVWQVSDRASTRPELSDNHLNPLKKVPDQEASTIATAPTPSVPAVPSKPIRPALPATEASPQPASSSVGERITLPAATTTVRPIEEPSPPETMVPPSAIPSVPARPGQAAAPTPVPVEVSPPQPSKTVPDTGQTAEAAPEPEKTYRSDPRIDLQALVWAPDPAARFVVINNRLIKEGGSVDSITVVKINPDDVLLAEDADRWFVEFNIR